MTDILNLQMPNSDRDLHIVAPIVEYLSVHHGLKIVSENINNGYLALLRYRPKLVLMANPYGQTETLEVLKAAHHLGVKAVTIVVEGNFQREQISGYLWGWNEERFLWEDTMLLWNEKSRNIAIEAYPETAPKLKVCGGTGFDRYKMLDFTTKDEFLRMRGSSKRKVVGIAGWGIFSHLLDTPYMAQFREFFFGEWSDEKIAEHMGDLAELRAMFRQLVIDNPDIDFILRMHPQAQHLDQTEFSECGDLPNAFISNQHDAGTLRISDVISASDVWLAYESGTAIEAWLMGKQTFLINPRPFDDLREETHEGSPKVRTLAEVQAALDSFYATGKVPGFDALADKRESILAGVLGFTDGKNHVRAADYVLEQYRGAKRPGLSAYRPFPWKRMIWQASRYAIYPTWLYRKLRGEVGKSWFRRDPLESNKVRALYRAAFLRASKTPPA